MCMQCTDYNRRSFGRKANAFTIITIKCRYVIHKVRFCNNVKTQTELYSPAQNQFDPELWYKFFSLQFLVG